MTIEKNTFIPEENQHYYATPIRDSEDKAWTDLDKYMEKHAKNKWAFFRQTPSVSSDYNFDTKVFSYRGFVRFIVYPMDYSGMDGSTFNIPNIGDS